VQALLTDFIARQRRTTAVPGEKVEVKS
jgi:hypothetical protein